MSKVDIISVLQEQLKSSNATIASLLGQVERLNRTIDGLKGTIQNLEALLKERDESLVAAKNQASGLAKLLNPKSEKQPLEKKQPLTSQELEERNAKIKEAAKQRGNNGAKRKMHFEMETIEQTLYPSEIENPELYPKFSCTQTTRYEMIPPRFIKHIYNIVTIKKDNVLYSAKAPLSPIQNSNFDSSFIAGIAELRYLYSMPVERIVKYFQSHGFDITKQTAHGLLTKTEYHFKKLYDALRIAIKEDPYLIGDETYHRVLNPCKEGGSMKAYVWGLLAVHLKLAYFFYDDGSRRQEVILQELADFFGLIQSDGLKAYKNLEKGSGGNIIRAACLQHCKRAFIDKDLENNEDAKEVTRLCNQLYNEEHKHTIGLNGWTTEQNLEWRQTYAKPILRSLSVKLKEIVNNEQKYPPSCKLRKAAVYMLNEWDGIETIFTRGDVALDSNAIERLNRYVSLSRKNSLFFGSHAGARRGCFFYSLACSCRLNGINFFEYMTDVLNSMAQMKDGLPPESYRDLLPDRWKKE